MYPPAPPARRRVLFAVTISALLHAAIGIGWWAAPDRSAIAGTPSATAVDGPDDGETIFVLRDRPAERPRPLPPSFADAGPATPPAVLPASVTGTTTKAPDPGAFAQPGISPAGHDSLPKSAGTKLLHGPLKPGQSVVYVLDRSSSMGIDGLLPAAVAAIKASLDQLGPEVRFGIVAYNGGSSTFSSGLLLPTWSNVVRAAGWLSQLRAEGRSNHAAGMREGLWLRPDAIVLLTDADDLDEAEVSEIAKLMRTPIRLDVAIFGAGRPAVGTPLERLVREHGGGIQYVGR